MKQRTIQQNKSLHLFCQQLADILNEAGYDMKRVLKHDVEIPWTMENCKNHLWRPIQKALTDKQSTTALDTVEPSQIHQILSRHLADKLGVAAPPWPCEETQHDVENHEGG